MSQETTNTQEQKDSGESAICTSADDLSQGTLSIKNTPFEIKSNNKQSLKERLIAVVDKIEDMGDFTVFGILLEFHQEKT